MPSLEIPGLDPSAIKIRGLLNYLRKNRKLGLARRLKRAAKKQLIGDSVNSGLGEDRPFDDIITPDGSIGTRKRSSEDVIWTQDMAAVLRVANQINNGAVHVNGPAVHDEPQLPHGGRKASGYARRLGEHWGIDEFLATKL
ncbi:hypothetical protein RUND412_002501 [Rhizina undulata]